MINFDQYLTDLLELAKPFSKSSIVSSRINLITNFDQQLKMQKIPTQNLTKLVFSESEIISLAEINFDLKRIENLDYYLSYFRQYLQEKYGYWATITEPFLKSLTQNFSFETSLELMAGNGYISKFLYDQGITAYATDSMAWSKESETGKKELIPIEKLDALAAFEKYYDKVEIIFLAWSPDFDEIDYQILEKYRKIKQSKPKFFIIGEQNGATNSKKFWNSVNIIDALSVSEVNKNYSNYDIIEDQLYLID